MHWKHAGAHEPAAFVPMTDGESAPHVVGIVGGGGEFHGVVPFAERERQAADHPCQPEPLAPVGPWLDLLSRNDGARELRTFTAEERIRVGFAALLALGRRAKMGTAMISSRSIVLTGLLGALAASAACQVVSGLDGLDAERSGAGGGASAAAAVGSGGTSGSGGGSGDGGAGQGGSGCAEACPTPMSPCSVATCKDGECAFKPIPAGSVPDPTPGDCQALFCDAEGDAMLVPDASDVPDDSNECTTDACDGASPTHTPTPGSACAQGVCDEGGACVAVECQTAADCGAATECTTQECVFGLCKAKLQPAGTFCNGLADQCDGNGSCVDCVNSGGCDECCVCANNICVPA